jgi:hypothetical protein
VDEGGIDFYSEMHLREREREEVGEVAGWVSDPIHSPKNRIGVFPFFLSLSLFIQDAAPSLCNIYFALHKHTSFPSSATSTTINHYHYQPSTDE